jgi:N-acetylglucosaminyl-diphospho-decaprenol L-rhamnosyltransferase
MATSSVPAHGVIVHRNQPEAAAHLAACFLGAGVEPVVVDNGSAPAQQAEMHRRLQARCPGAAVRVLEAGRNLGFGPGANLGLRWWLLHASTDWVLVAPHDARPEDGCIARLLTEAAARPRAGLACAEFGPGFDAVPVIDQIIGAYWRDAERGDGWVEVDYAHGTLLAARRQMCEEVGLFDERYFAYCEEADLALRARLADWAVGMVWGAVVANDQLPARPVVDYLQLRNTLLLVREWYGVKPARAREILAAFHLASLCARRPTQAATHLLTHGRAIVDYRAHRFGPPPPAVLARQEGARLAPRLPPG